jgi:phage-related protein
MSDYVQLVLTSWFRAELDELPTDQSARVSARLRLLQRKGWTYSVQTNDVEELEDGIYEVKVHGKGPAYRVLFFVVPGNPGRLVVLTNCVAKGLLKKGNVKRAQILRAKHRRDEWLKGGDRW